MNFPFRSRRLSRDRGLNGKDEHNRAEQQAQPVGEAIHGASATRLKAIADDRKLPAEERFAARLKLAELPRNSSPTRIRNRCELTGRAARLLPQAANVAHRAARLGSQGLIPGMIKSSW